MWKSLDFQPSVFHSLLMSTTPEYKPVRITIETQGEVLVNQGYVEAEGENVVALTIDLRTKRAEMMGSIWTSSDDLAGVMLSAGPDTLHSDESKKGIPTEILFPDYPGYHVHCADVARYTLRVCLVKPTNP